MVLLIPDFGFYSPNGINNRDMTISISTAKMGASDSIARAPRFVHVRSGVVRGLLRIR